VIVDLRAADTATCGGKAGALGHLMRAGIRVPDGFVVLPSGTGAQIAAALAGLGGGPMAVRSSASTEDTVDASAAGQHDSFLGVRGADAVVDGVRRCRESLWSPRAVAYRHARGQRREPVMAVLVQHHVDADVAGVAFTGDTVRVEAAWGLGESVAHGLVTPDSWTVASTGVTAHATGDKHLRVDRSATGTAHTGVPVDDRHRPCLTDGQVRRIAATARRIEAVLGRPVDVEWAVAADEIWVLQARPVTVAPPRERERGQGRLTGTPGSPGIATGPARILRGPADFAGTKPGDIIVCRSTDPAWTPLFAIAAGFVTETGGVLSHAAIVAREHRVPAVLGVPDATTSLTPGRQVTVDGTHGTVKHP
jgi:pyruvate, water dikinase